MARIRRVASAMLAEKIADAAAVQADGEAKRDIMSLLVRARIAETRGKTPQVQGYAMSDEAMMDQVVCSVYFLARCGVYNTGWMLMWSSSLSLGRATRLRRLDLLGCVGL